MSRLGLLSRIESQLAADWRQFPSQATDGIHFILLGGAQGEKGAFNPVHYTHALLDGDLDGTVDRLILGASVTKTLPEQIVRGLAGALKSLAPANLVVEVADGAKTAEITLSDDDLKLGRWLIDTLKACDEAGLQALSVKEVEYFIGSGAYRAQGLATALRAGFPNRLFASATDIGAGIGLISYLLAPLIGMQSAALVEPLQRYEPAAQGLWRTKSNLQMSFIQMTAEQQHEAAAVRDPVDLVIICQCFFRVSAAKRKDVLAGAWQTLNPGGVLMINEILDRGGQVGPGGQTLLTVEDIVDLFSGLAPPKVYLGRDRWQKGHRIGDVDRSAFVSDTIIAAQKSGAH